MNVTLIPVLICIVPVMFVMNTRTKNELRALDRHVIHIDFFLDAILRNDCVNILVAQSHLVTALVQLLMYDLSDSFNIDDVYSCAGSGWSVVFYRASA